MDFFIMEYVSLTHGYLCTCQEQGYFILVKKKKTLKLDTSHAVQDKVAPRVLLLAALQSCFMLQFLLVLCPTPTLHLGCLTLGINRGGPHFQMSVLRRALYELLCQQFPH